MKTTVGPSATAESNELRMGNEADLLEPLEVMCEKPGEMPSVDCVILDGAAVFQSLDPCRTNGQVTTFEEYATKAFLPYVFKQVRSVSRIDVIFDVCKEDSLKSHTRQIRETGKPVQVAPTTRILLNWKTTETKSVYISISRR